MLTLYYTPGACSMAAHIVLEESGEDYEAKKVDLAGGEQRTEAYLKINPLGRVPALLLDNGEPLAENTAIPMASSSTRGVCAANSRWESSRTTRHSRTGCSNGLLSDAWWTANRSRCEQALRIGICDCEQQVIWVNSRRQIAQQRLSLSQI
jgi:Glutathione S-transferase, N-terminal domain